jgi:ubiquinone/menaquinone biosynthesis C-methylase UbiE
VSVELPGEPSQVEHAARVARTYSAASDHYLRPALRFWDRWGAATVARAPLAPGNAVLDLCCGAGGSALPAARAVGPDGRVLGLDLAGPLLELARQRAAAMGLGNVSFEQRDATVGGSDSESFDAVVCVFGVFFAADMPGFVAHMWRLVRPGGTLAITTWGPGWCEPASGVFWNAVRSIEPALVRAFNPWDHITTADALTELLARGGVTDPTVHATSDQYHGLDRVDDFWDIALGSGYRATIDALDPPARQVLRNDVLDQLRSQNIARVRNDVVFATATKQLSAPGRPDAARGPARAVSEGAARSVSR